MLKNPIKADSFPEINQSSFLLFLLFYPEEKRVVGAGQTKNSKPSLFSFSVLMRSENKKGAKLKGSSILSKKNFFF